MSKNNVLSRCPECKWANKRKKENCIKCGASLIRNGSGHARPKRVVKQQRNSCCCRH